MVVDDSEYDALATSLRAFCITARSVADSHVSELEAVLAEAAVEGSFATNLGLYLELVRTLSLTLEELAGESTDVPAAFVRAVDEADEYLY
jgi:hypothetical protein